MVTVFVTMAMFVHLTMVVFVTIIEIIFTVRMVVTVVMFVSVFHGDFCLCYHGDVYYSQEFKSGILWWGCRSRVSWRLST